MDETAWARRSLATRQPGPHLRNCPGRDVPPATPGGDAESCPPPQRHTPPLPFDATSDAPLALTPRRVFLASGSALLGLKSVLVCALPLFGDEAFYWLEGQHLPGADSDLPGRAAAPGRSRAPSGGADPRGGRGAVRRAQVGPEFA